MRLAIVSDIHGNLPALEAVVADAGAVDGWLNLGDTVAGPLWPAATAARLMALAWPTIAGNHERQMLHQAWQRMDAIDRHTRACLAPEQLAWLAALPATLEPVAGLVCLHGRPGCDHDGLLETVTPRGMRPATPAEVAQRLGSLQAGLVLCGHTHLPRLMQLGGTLVVNPGSVGLQAYRHDMPHLHVVETGTPQARYAIATRRAGRWQAELRSVAYDHEAAAMRAETAGRTDWAFALRTGQVAPLTASVGAG